MTSPHSMKWHGRPTPTPRNRDLDISSAGMLLMRDERRGVTSASGREAVHCRFVDRFLRAIDAGCVDLRVFLSEMPKRLQ